MESLIPEHFLQVTKVSTTEILEDGTTVVALFSTSRQLLELVEGKVVDSCDIDSDADDISIFTSYDPLQKYYLLRCQSCLVVVKRKPLCVFKEYRDVVEVKIEDRLMIGRPQVVIWTQNNKEPIVTDFVGQLLTPIPRTVPVLTASLTGKLQEMNARVAKVQRLVQEKRSVRCTALYRFTPHLSPPEPDTECEPKVLAWGPPLPLPSTRGPATDPPLQLSHPWTKIHNGKWIIGIPVCNTTNSTVQDITLRLRQSGGGSEPHLKYKCLVVKFVQRSSSGAEWMEPHHSGAVIETVDEIAGKTSAVVIGVLEEPLFKISSVVSLSGAIIYKRSNQLGGADFQDVLSKEISLKVEDLIQGTLTPFSPQNAPNESDLVSVIVSSQRWQLCATPCHLMPPPLKTALEMAGLVQVVELGCWVGPTTNGGSLAGLLILLGEPDTQGGACHLHVYAREMRQALLLARSLQTQWKVGVGRERSATLQDCIASLRAELCALRSIVRPGAEYTPEEWEKTRDKLSSLELATDLSFESHMSI